MEKKPVSSRFTGGVWSISVVIGLASLLGLAGPTSTLDRPEQIPPATVTVQGAPQVVFDWSRERCTAGTIPDAPVRAFRDASGRIQMTLAHIENRMLVGSSFNDLTPSCRVVLSSQQNPNPKAFADREWIHSLYTADGSTIVALVHDEYQGDRHPGRCKSGIYEKCWYNAVTMAVSTNQGKSYALNRGGAKLVASLPSRYVPDTGPVGIFSPSNIVRNPRDGLFYLLVRIVARGSVRGTCVMRTGHLFRPGSWRAWDGHSFSIKFFDPYSSTPARSRRLCTAVSQAAISGMTDSLTYNTELNSFLLVGVAGQYRPEQDKIIWGIYYSTSEDLIHWTDRRLLMRAPLPWVYACGDSPPVAYPSVVDPASPSRSFDSSGARPFLYYTQFHIAGCAETQDRDLVRVPLLVSR